MAYPPYVREDTNNPPDGYVPQSSMYAPQRAFEQLDLQMPTDERRVSRVVNGSMQGKLNCVNELEVPASAFPLPTQKITVFDSRVSPYSYVAIHPLTDAALLIHLDYTGTGYFNLTLSSIVMQALPATGSMEGLDEVVNITTTGVQFPFDTEAGLPLKRMLLSLPTLTTQVSGLYYTTIRFDAVVIKNKTYYIDVMVDGAATKTFEHVLGAQQDDIHDFFAGYMDLDTGVDVTLRLRNNTGTTAGVVSCSLTLNRVDNSPTYQTSLPASDYEDLRFKYAVIG